MRSLDTNVLLRFLMGDVPPQYEKVRQLIESSASGSLKVEDGVLFELVWVTSGPMLRLQRMTIAKMLKQVIATKQLNCNRDLVSRVLPIYVAHPGVSFFDICLSIYAENNDATPLLTFDKKLAKTVPDSVELL